MQASCASNTITKIMTPVADTLYLSDGSMLHYLDETGTGTPVVMIHGLGSNSKAWHKVVEACGEDLRPIVVDLPRYMDDPLSKKISLERYASYLVELLDSLNIKESVVVGHSMGGQVALHMAHKAPDRVSQMILCAPAGLEEFSEKDRAWFKAFVTPQFYASLSPEAVKRNFDINFYGDKTPQDALFMYEDRMQLSADSIAFARYNESIVGSVMAMLTEPVAGLLEDISVPTTILLPDSDKLIPNKYLHPDMTEEDLRSVAEQLPNHSIKTVDKSGHFIIWDRPDAVAQAIHKSL